MVYRDVYWVSIANSNRCLSWPLQLFKPTGTTTGITQCQHDTERISRAREVADASYRRDRVSVSEVGIAHQPSLDAFARHAILGRIVS